MAIQNHFIQWFEHSLKNISDGYYTSQNWMSGPRFVIENSNLDEKTAEKYKLKSEKNYERVFCYELYHQLRTTMKEYFPKDEVVLQAELRKEQVSSNLLRNFEETFKNIKSLDGIYYPDFVLHQPTNFDNQSLIVEVKTNSQLNAQDFKKDILKIVHFIENYRYEKGLFLAVNIAENNKKHLCKKIAKSILVKEGAKSSSSQIFILFKESKNKKLDFFSLKSLIESKGDIDQISE